MSLAAVFTGRKTTITDKDNKKYLYLKIAFLKKLVLEDTSGL
jgi:hypothetical protein